MLSYTSGSRGGLSSAGPAGTALAGLSAAYGGGSIVGQRRDWRSMIPAQVPVNIQPNVSINPSGVTGSAFDRSFQNANKNSLFQNTLSDTVGLKVNELSGVPEVNYINGIEVPQANWEVGSNVFEDPVGSDIVPKMPTGPRPGGGSGAIGFKRRAWDAEMAAFNDWKTRNHNEQFGYAHGGVVGGDGGLGSLMSNQAQQPQPMPVAPQAPVAPQPVDGLSPEESQLIDAAKLALSPNSPFSEEDKRAIFTAFEDLFGPGSVEELKAQLGEENLGGMADDVTAVIDGKQKTNVSTGELVVSNPDLANVGNGDREAGAQTLEKMFEELRVLKTGNPNKPPAINMGGLAGAIA